MNKVTTKKNYITRFTKKLAFIHKTDKYIRLNITIKARNNVIYANAGTALSKTL